MNNNNKTYKYLLFCGDIHGEYDIIPNFIRDNELTDCAIFVAGDFGVGFEIPWKDMKQLENFNKRLINSNSVVFAIRGNHDNPSYFDGSISMSNLHLIADYTVININGVNVLGVGGAISVDRTKRKNYFSKPNKNPKAKADYWHNEKFIYNEEIVSKLRNIDIVVTHSSPHFCMPISNNGLKYWMEFDENINNDTMVERNKITQLYEGLIVNNELSEWYYGHFHLNAKTYDGDVTFTALNINEIVESKKNIYG